MTLSDGARNSLQQAIGQVEVAYSGTSLIGDGGLVEAFSVPFTIEDVAYKGDQLDGEHVDVSCLATGVLTNVVYSDYTAGVESITATVLASGLLTRVEDI